MSSKPRIKDEDVVRIKEMKERMPGARNEEIAVLCNVSSPTVSRIIAGKYDYLLCEDYKEGKEDEKQEPCGTIEEIADMLHVIGIVLIKGLIVRDDEQAQMIKRLHNAHPSLNFKELDRREV